MTTRTSLIKTAGHSNHPIERFVELLKNGGVDVLVDVRSTPYSRRCPQFGRERLAQALTVAGIGYAYEGAALGGKGGGSYDAVAAKPEFKDAVGRLIAQSGERRLCLMCAEKDPLDCHRTVLVSRRLAERGAGVEHLLADGGSRRHIDIEDALLAKNLRAPDLFSAGEDRATRLAQAWQAQERRMRGKT